MRTDEDLASVDDSALVRGLPRVTRSLYYDLLSRTGPLGYVCDEDLYGLATLARDNDPTAVHLGEAGTAVGMITALRAAGLLVDLDGGPPRNSFRERPRAGAWRAMTPLEIEIAAMFGGEVSQ